MTPLCLPAARRLSLGLAVALAACAAPPTPAPVANNSYLVLLDEDGNTGQVRFNSARGETVLDRPLQATRLATAANNTFEATPALLARDFGPVLAALPTKPQSFLLYFLPGGARLTPESEAAVPQILQSIASRPVPDMSVTGHTDTAGDAETNLRLGMERAQFVARLLGGAQLDPSRLQVESHGKRNLLVATPDNVAEPRNRRVEVTVR